MLPSERPAPELCTRLAQLCGRSQSGGSRVGNWEQTVRRWQGEYGTGSRGNKERVSGE